MSVVVRAAPLQLQSCARGGGGLKSEEEEGLRTLNGLTQ